MRLKLQCHSNQLTFHLKVKKKNKKINPIPLEPQGRMPPVNSLLSKPFSSPGLLGISEVVRVRMPLSLLHTTHPQSPSSALGSSAKMHRGFPARCHLQRSAGWTLAAARVLPLDDSARLIKQASWGPRTTLTRENPGLGHLLQSGCSTGLGHPLRALLAVIFEILLQQLTWKGCPAAAA